jgi:hypothetical protein
MGVDKKSKNKATKNTKETPQVSTKTSDSDTVFSPYGEYEKNNGVGASLMADRNNILYEKLQSGESKAPDLKAKVNDDGSITTNFIGNNFKQAGVQSATTPTTTNTDSAATQKQYGSGMKHSIKDGLIENNFIDTAIQDAISPKTIDQHVSNTAKRVANELYGTEDDTEAPVSSFEEMLKKRRKALIQEKTDALKMKKYHALADVFKTLGHMGGAVVGGAVGGNVLDSMPDVGEYKQSKGYIDAFENAKEASKRLDALDDTEFTLAYSAEEKKEKRAYERAVEQEKRAYNYAVEQEKRAYEAKRDALKMQWEAATIERRGEIQKEINEENRAHQIRMFNLNASHDKNMEALRQKNRKELKQDEDLIPIQYKGGPIYYVPKKYYNSMRRDLIKDNNFKDGTPVTAKNIDEYIRTDYNKVYMYLKKFGIDARTGKPISSSKGGKNNGSSKGGKTTAEILEEAGV